MNLEDLAKKAIDEVNTELEQFKQVQLEQVQNVEITKEINIESNDEIPTQEEVEKEGFSVHEHFEDDSIKQVLSTDELFLKNIRERILVLFEGLNNTQKQDLESRLELTIHFLEFLLASIEDKLKK